MGKEKLKFKCQMSGKCCKPRATEGYVFLTEEDITRIEKHTNQVRDQFARYDKFLNLETDEIFFKWHLKNTTVSPCEFLKDNLCSIHEIKPEQCKTWPHWPENLNADGSWNMNMVAFCDGINKE